MSRSASLLLGFGGSRVGVKIRFGLDVRRGVDCVEGGSFMASHLGVVLRCVVRLTSSWEAFLGHRVSECVVASRVW